MAESPALQLNLSSNVQTETDTADATAASAPKPSMDTVLADQQTKSEAKHLQKPANEETLAATAAADASTSEPAEASASLSIPMDQSRKASRTQALGFSQSKSQTHTQSEMAAAAQPSASSEIDSPQSIMPQAVISASEPTSAPSCASLSTRDCLQSSHCTYELKSESDIAGNRYSCRNAVDQCERNFQQLTDTQQSCESKPGCRFIPGHCECAQGMPCDCRNENPPQCTSDKQSSDDERN
jgi:hypothetical protein